MTKNSLLLRLSLSRRMASLYISKSRLASDALYLYRTPLDFLCFLFFCFMVYLTRLGRVAKEELA